MANLTSYKQKIFFICTVLLGLTTHVIAADIAEHPRKIIVFKETFVSKTKQAELARNYGAGVIKPLALINALAAYLPPQAERALLENAEVLRIDDDLVINAIAKKPLPPQPQEELPWGVDRINAELAWQATKGLAVKVAILDTGIDLDHLDLQSNIKGNVNAINPLLSGNDNNGHGSHVAGIVAAIDNNIGVIGVGPEIYLYAVKVLDRTGSGWLSDLIEGIEWCINNKMEVINMSLGSSSDNQSFHDAIIRAYQAAIVLVAAAGNNGETTGAVNYPAKYPEAIAVSAVDQAGRFASFSSFGPEVDLAAPGVSVKSTYNDGYYRTLSGTSMAAPHVSAVAALILSTPVGIYDLDSDSLWDPSEVKSKLETTAENLGLSSYQQGAGLARADLAVQ